jgi:hypothetical protein
MFYISAAFSEPATHMPVRVKFSGCLFSIIASVVLTVVLNLLLRSCS